MTISPLDLSDALQKVLTDAVQDIKDQVNAEAREIAEDVCNNLKRHSPKDKGDYAKSWTVDEKEGTAFLGTKNYVIHNKRHYRLTHLLEYGHANRDGGRTNARPHIEKIANAASNEFERRVKNICGN